MTQAIRLLSSQPYTDSSRTPPGDTNPSEPPDPFTAGALTYSTTGRDFWTAPSAFATNSHAWVHIFPEGYVHQDPRRDLRYFKWGVSRLILESEPAPDVVPMFVEGTDWVMPEDRGFPRFVPRIGSRIRVTFGDVLDFEETFGDLRRRWRRLTEASRKRGSKSQGREEKTAAMALLGELPDDLKYGAEAEEIRIEVAYRMRNEVLQLRTSLGYPDGDPSYGLARTWAEPVRKGQ